MLPIGNQRKLVKTTCRLLCVSAVLSVLAVFDTWLRWDILGPQAEAVVRALFASSLILGLFGALITVILSAASTAVLLERIANAHLSEGGSNKADGGFLLLSGRNVAIIVTILVGGCWALNELKEVRRDCAFRKVSDELMVRLGPHIVSDLSSVPVRSRVPHPIHETLRALEDQTFIHTATLYVLDPEEVGVMWGYRAWRKYEIEDGFARFFVTKNFERLMERALRGQTKSMEELNNLSRNQHYVYLKSKAGEVSAIVRIDAESSEAFGEYSQ